MSTWYGNEREKVNFSFVYWCDCVAIAVPWWGWFNIIIHEAYEISSAVGIINSASGLQQCNCLVTVSCWGQRSSVSKKRLRMDLNFYFFYSWMGMTLGSVSLRLLFVLHVSETNIRGFVPQWTFVNMYVILASTPRPLLALYILYESAPMLISSTLVIEEPCYAHCDNNMFKL